jgi:octaprenyl-diphosphate synthase
VVRVAGVHQRRELPKPSLDPLTRLLKEDLDAVNRLIVERMHSPVALIPRLASHIVAGGGKRLRPMLTLGCARMCGYCGKRHIALAAAVEFIHTATLLHDDVVDASDLRRGRDTANAVWGNKPAVLVGDFLFSRSFELMVADGSLRVLEILSRAAAVIAEGEVLQLTTTGNMATTEADYLTVIQSKTAELFAAAARIGAVLAGRPEAEEEALDRFGRNLGIAFQLVDDMLDFSAQSSELGKSVGDDLRDGKVTLPVLIAFARGDDDERRFWRRTIEDLDQRPGDLERAIDLVARRGALAETAARARAYAAAASRALGAFADGPERLALAAAAQFAGDRRF